MLIEALVALAVFTAVFLVLEGSWTFISRTLACAASEGVASQLAEQQRERILAVGCAPSVGADSIRGVTVAWTATAVAGTLRMHQTATYKLPDGIHMESFDLSGRCE